MRITGSILRDSATNALQRNLREVERASSAVSSGVRVQQPSDDPVGASVMLETDGRLRALDQYGRNIASLETRLAREESVLDGAGTLLSRARELAVAAGTDTASPQARAAIRAEAAQLQQQLFALANTMHGETYLFGGAFADRAPVAADGSFSATHPPTGAAAYQIGDGQVAHGPRGAVEAFGDTGALAGMQNLLAAIDSGDTAAIAQAGSQLKSAHDRVQDLISETGARALRVSAARENVDALGLTLRTFRASVAEVDIETAVSDLVRRQTAVQAAMMATSRVLSLNLTDYLR